MNAKEPVWMHSRELAFIRSSGSGIEMPQVCYCLTGFPLAGYACGVDVMNEQNETPGGEILVYTAEDGSSRIRVLLEDETVWLTQMMLAALYETTKQNISLHIRNILSEGELDESAVVKDYLTTASDGKQYRVKHYNLDMIIAVGYRVRSPRGTQQGTADSIL